MPHFNLNLDGFYVNGERQSLALELRATVGDEVELTGWAVDRETGLGARALTLFIDGRIQIGAQTCMPRPDLIPVVGQQGRDCGFSIRIPTAALTPSVHLLTFMITAPSRVEWVSFAMSLQLEDPPDPPPRPKQIVVATAMKSAGKHVQSVLLAYFGIENPAFGGASDAEQIVNDDVIRSALDAPFVMNAHMIARAVSMDTLAYWGLRVFQTWRNLGDTVISLDEHTLKAADDEWRNAYAYIEDRALYAALPVQRRYRYQIRNAIPWYLTFYTSWRRARARLFMRYEWMATDPQGYFRYLLSRLDRNVDELRLMRLVAAGPGERSNFNVGLVGRSKSHLDEESQAMLEACIREHPSDVRELLYELPWYAAKYPAPVLARTVAGEIYLLAEGARHRASEHWIVTHQCDPARITVIEAADLMRIPSGADLF